MSLLDWASRVGGNDSHWFLLALKDVLFGIIAGQIHAAKLLWITLYWNIFIPILMSLRLIRTRDALLPKVENGTIKVMHVGYGRTGTHSLHFALNELGFRTAHTHLWWHEQVEVMDWYNEHVVAPSIKEGKVLVQDHPLDFQKLADYGYTALIDMPISLHYEEVLKQFPGCKFILTERSSAELWFQSWDFLMKSHVKVLHFGGLFLPAIKTFSDFNRWIMAYINKDPSILNEPWPATDQTNKETAIQSYEEHNRRVKQVIPADKLLVYDFKDGWRTICEFLEMENCPATPYPKSNTRLSFIMQPISSLLFVLGVIYAAFLVVRRMFHRKQSHHQKLE